MHNTERGKLQNDHAAGYPHIQWTGLLKLEDWLMDIETASDILTEGCTCLAEAKLHSLTQTLIHKAIQAGNCWDETRGILRLKFCKQISILTCQTL